MKPIKYKVFYIGGSTIIQAESRWEAAYRISTQGYNVLSVEVLQ